MQCFTCSRTLCRIIMPVARWHSCTRLRCCLVIIHIYFVPNDISCLQTVKKTIYWNKIRKNYGEVYKIYQLRALCIILKDSKGILLSVIYFFRKKQNIEKIYIHIINVRIFNTENVWTLQYLGYSVLKYIENTTMAFFQFQRKSTFFHISGN